MSLQNMRSLPTGQVGADRSTRRPYGQLPHDIAADPRLIPIDVAILLALTFWARDKDHCWPADTSIGLRVGRSRATVQRRLKHLEVIGLVGREKTTTNFTGRILRLQWRVAPRRAETPPAPLVRQPPLSPVRQELSNKQEKENAGPIALTGEPAGPMNQGDKLITDMTVAERNSLFAGLSFPGLSFGRANATNATTGPLGEELKSAMAGLTPTVQSWSKR